MYSLGRARNLRSESPRVVRASVWLPYADCERMGDAFYHGPPYTWNSSIPNHDLYAHKLIRIVPRQQVDQKNERINTHGNRLPLQPKYEPHLLSISHSFSSSTSSSPVSSGSSDDCHNSAERLHSISCLSPQQTRRRELCEAPIDLSKPKSRPCQTALHKSSTSRLSRLLTRKRRSEDEICCEQTGPLNLSTKGNKTVRAWSEPAIGDIVDMKDAVDNPVQLAEILHQSEIAQQVTQHLTEMLNMVFAMRQFHSVQEADRIQLLMNCWHRLLLWIFAENKFTFQVRSLSCAPIQPEEASGQKRHQPQLNHPSMAFVHSVASFIKKYETLQIDKEEMRLLFLITLFHTPESESYLDATQITEHRKHWMKMLQSYTQVSERGGAKRYSDLLLYLPMLYGINDKMVEGLFLEHLTANVSIDTLLTEAVKSYQHD